MKMKTLAIAAVAALVAGPAMAENWHIYSRSAANVFMVDIDSIAVEGDMTSARVATVPRQTEAGDYSHTLETFQFQCAGPKWRTAGMVEYGPDGAQTGVIPEEGSPWEDIRSNTSPDFVKAMACDGVRANPPHFPTIQAFIDAGRP